MKKLATIPADKVMKVIIGPVTGVQVHEIDGSYSIEQEYGSVTLTYDQLTTMMDVIETKRKCMRGQATDDAAEKKCQEKTLLRMVEKKFKEDNQ